MSIKNNSHKDLANLPKVIIGNILKYGWFNIISVLNQHTKLKFKSKDSDKFFSCLRIFLVAKYLNLVTPNHKSGPSLLLILMSGLKE